MELATIIGLIVGIGGILLGNLIEGGEIASLVQGAAAIIVLSGTFGAVLVTHKMSTFKKAMSSLKIAFKKQNYSHYKKTKNKLIELSKIAKKESVLELEKHISNLDTEFLRSAMHAVVDGADANTIRETFESRIQIEEEHDLQQAKVFIDAGGYCPTIGIIGAVLGLIHVMGNLSDTSKLGAGIAVAFVATVYGVGLANLVFLPLGNKLKAFLIEKSHYKQMCLEGALAIKAGLNPILVESKLAAFIPSDSE